MNNTDERKAIEAWNKKFGIEKSADEIIEERNRGMKKAQEAWEEKFGKSKLPEFDVNAGLEKAKAAWEKMMEEKNAKI